MPQIFRGARIYPGDGAAGAGEAARTCRRHPRAEHRADRRRPLGDRGISGQNGHHGPRGQASRGAAWGPGGGLGPGGRLGPGGGLGAGAGAGVSGTWGPGGGWPVPTGQAAPPPRRSPRPAPPGRSRRPAPRSLPRARHAGLRDQRGGSVNQNRFAHRTALAGQHGAHDRRVVGGVAAAQISTEAGASPGSAGENPVLATRPSCTTQTDDGPVVVSSSRPSSPWKTSAEQPRAASTPGEHRAHPRVERRRPPAPEAGPGSRPGRGN